MVFLIIGISLLIGYGIQLIVSMLVDSLSVKRIPVLITTTLITITAYSFYGLNLEFFFNLVFWYGLIVVAWVDYYTLTVVDLTVYGLAGWAVLYHLIMKTPISDKIIGGFIGFLFYLIIYITSKAYYKKEAFGFGDVLLMGAVGVYLGFVNGLLAGLMSFYLALIGVALQKALGKRMGLKQEVAFGPSICLAAVVTSVFGDKIITWYVNSFLF